MFDIGFSEIVVIFVLALIVLGPEKLPKVVREVGRWVGRARAMARQFQEQLEEEVDRPRTIRPEPVRAVGGVPAPAAPPRAADRAEPVQADPLQADPLQADPLQADPLQADPLQADPVQAQAVRAEVAPGLAAVTYVEPTLGAAALSPSDQPESLGTEGVAHLHTGTHERGT